MSNACTYLKCLIRMFHFEFIFSENLLKWKNMKISDNGFKWSLCNNNSAWNISYFFIHHFVEKEKWYSMKLIEFYEILN